MWRRLEEQKVRSRRPLELFGAGDQRECAAEALGVLGDPGAELQVIQQQPVVSIAQTVAVGLGPLRVFEVMSHATTSYGVSISPCLELSLQVSAPGPRTAPKTQPRVRNQSEPILTWP